MGPRRARLVRAHAKAFIGENVAAEADLLIGVVARLAGDRPCGRHY